MDHHHHHLNRHHHMQHQQAVHHQQQSQHHHQSQVHHSAHLQQQQHIQHVSSQQHPQMHHHQRHVQPPPPPPRQLLPHEKPMPEGVIGIYVKTLKEKKCIQVKPAQTIKEFRKKIAGYWCTNMDTLCLVHGGQLLADIKTVEDYALKNGMTIHMVIKQVNKNQCDVGAELSSTPGGRMGAPPQKSDITATPFGLGTMGGLAGIASIGMGSVNFMEMQQRMQREVLSNPESLRIIMENPMVRQMMDQPEMMHQLMMANPQMRELVEGNPEITQMMHNRELMATISDLAKNPAMLQELIRSEDRIALSSSEDIGPSLGVRLPEEDDDIIFVGTAEELGMGSYRGMGGLGHLMRGAWGPRGRRLPPPVSHMFNTAPMRSLLLQMTESPQVMQNMFSAPYVQTMMSSLNANPELAHFVASQNPTFKDNPKLAEQIPDLVAQATAQMLNPAVQGLMTNPKALQALLQIQRGLATVQTEIPEFMDSFAIPHDPKAEEMEVEEGKEKPKRDPKEDFPLLMNQMANTFTSVIPGTKASSLPPESKYGPQVKQLATLGFSNREAVIDALVATSGDVNGAIQRLVPKARPAFDL